MTTPLASEQPIRLHPAVEGRKASDSLGRELGRVRHRLLHRVNLWRRRDHPGEEARPNLAESGPELLLFDQSQALFINVGVGPFAFKGPQVVVDWLIWSREGGLWHRLSVGRCRSPASAEGFVWIPSLSG